MKKHCNHVTSHSRICLSSISLYTRIKISKLYSLWVKKVKREMLRPYLSLHTPGWEFSPRLSRNSHMRSDEERSYRPGRTPTWALLTDTRVPAANCGQASTKSCSGFELPNTISHQHDRSELCSHRYHYRQTIESTKYYPTPQHHLS